jgi:hypothetical protein
MGGHIYRNTSTSTPVGRVTGPWPTRPQASGSASKATININHGIIKDRQTVTVPDFVSKPGDFLPTKYGYQEVHKFYDEMRSFFAKKATSTYQNEVGTIKVTLMTLKPNCRNPQMVMVSKVIIYNSILIKHILKDITETISNIPLNIGVTDLKSVAYFTILPIFVKWSHDYPLSIENVKLRYKNWVEMLPKGPGDEDKNAIESEFYTIKGKAKTRQFLPNKVLDIYLGISYSMRCEIEDHIDNYITNKSGPSPVCYQVYLLYPYKLS